MRIDNPDERRFYEIEALNNNWSVRELQRQCDTSLYERLALSRDKQGIKQLAEQGQIIEKPTDILKDPYILEFLNLPEKHQYSESDLEAAIIDKLEHFLLELGKGFTFVARQFRMTIDEKHFRADLVFFNRLLKCFVVIDLKIGELSHQDLGQMQMYVNYHDRFVKLPDENKTIGIILCKQNCFFDGICRSGKILFIFLSFHPVVQNALHFVLIQLIDFLCRQLQGISAAKYRINSRTHTYRHRNLKSCIHHFGSGTRSEFHQPTLINQTKNLIILNQFVIRFVGKCVFCIIEI